MHLVQLIAFEHISSQQNQIFMKLVNLKILLLFLHRGALADQEKCFPDKLFLGKKCNNFKLIKIVLHY